MWVGSQGYSQGTRTPYLEMSQNKIANRRRKKKKSLLQVHRTERRNRYHAQISRPTAGRSSVGPVILRRSRPRPGPATVPGRSCRERRLPQHTTARLSSRARPRPPRVFEVTAPRPRGPTITRAARTADPVPAARARPLSYPGPLPKQRRPRGPLLLLSGRHGPSVPETGTSSR